MQNLASPRTACLLLHSLLPGLALACAASQGPSQTPDASPGWLQSVQEGLAAKEYEASHNGEGLQAPNRRHKLRTYFEPDGIRVVDREDPASPELLGLRFAAWGRTGAMVPAAPGEVHAEGNRVEIRREGLVEWFVNRPDGLEHGFTVGTRPQGEGELVFALTNERAAARLSGDAVRLQTDAGRRLRYAKLAAWDAEGTPLEARFEVPASDRVELVVADAGAVYPLTIDPLLTEAADAQLESGQALSAFGFSVSSVGDVNGDGYADVIVGAYAYDAGEADEGAAFVFIGSATGIGDGNPTTAHAQLESDQASARFGWTVSSAGDVNGDGYDDAIVGSFLYDAGEIDEGAAFVFLGSAAGIGDGNPTTAHARLESDQASAVFGRGVSSAGDVNGDGYDDVIVGAEQYDAGESDEGAAFVFLGSAAGIGDANPTTAHAQLESDQVSSGFGYSVSSAGDVDGDGYADAIVGAHSYDAGELQEGAAFVFLGGATGIGDGSPATAHAQLEADQANALLGSSVSSAGDVNGDGYADVIVGASRYIAGESDEGAAFVFLGSASGIGDGNPTTAHAQLESDQAGARLGLSVASAGDVNGDGYADVLVGAAHYDSGESNEGAAFVFLGSAMGIGDGDPTTAYAQLESDEVNAQLGTSVSSAGDVNGDGYDDVLAGVYFYSSGQSDEGAAFIYHGGASGITDGNPATAHAQLEMDQTSTQVVSAASAGDVNGDGYGDVIVGAYLYDAGQTDEGAAFVFLGSATGLGDGDPASAHAQLESNQTGAGLGRGVASAGDVNGDGYGDVIVGAWLFDAEQTDEGAAFIFLGGPAGLADGSSTTADTLLQSNQSDSAFGLRVASAGDVNGDGYGDVITTASAYDAGESDEGAAFVFLGGVNGIPDGDPSTSHAQLEGNQADARFGISGASAGDVNGDGYADVIIGADNYDVGAVDVGSAFVFLGSASGIADGDADTAETHLEGDQADADFGWSTASAGDVNGDGYGDVIVGARAYDAGETDEGVAFVFLGGSGGVVDGSPVTAHAQLESDQTGSESAWSVASAGDVNGDGYSDVIVGARRYTNGHNEEGAAFVFLGSASGIADGDPSAADALLETNQTGARLGFSVASAGDVNGDGYADVIVTAPTYDAGQVDEGAAFVFLGNSEGRPVRAQQRRGPATGVDRPVQPWGSSWDDDEFRVTLDATSPRGRERAKLEVETCASDVAFGDVSCSIQESASWIDLSTTGATLVETIPVASMGDRYRWRARVLYAPLAVTEPGVTAPPNPRHGPWRRHTAQAVEADVLPEPGTALGIACGAALLGAIARHRSRFLLIRGAPRTPLH